MMFFLLMAVATAGAVAIGWLTGQDVSPRLAMAWGMALALLFTGADHLLNPRRYLPMLPRSVPWPRGTIAFTGLCEIAGAAGLLLPPTRLLAGWALAIYFACVFPANVRNALGGLEADHLPAARWYYWARLPFQPVAIWWALFASGAVVWPMGN